MEERVPVIRVLHRHGGRPAEIDHEGAPPKSRWRRPSPCRRRRVSRLSPHAGLHPRMDRHEGQKLQRLRRQRGEGRIEPVEGRHRRVGGSMGPARGLNTGRDMRLRPGEVVGGLRRREHRVAVRPDAGAPVAQAHENALPAAVTPAEAHLPQDTPRRADLVEPVREGIGRPSRRIGRAPCRVEAEQHRLHRPPGQEQRGEAQLLVRRRGVDGEVAKRAAKAASRSAGSRSRAVEEPKTAASKSPPRRWPGRIGAGSCRRWGRADGPAARRP